ncbi:hypothetical protein HC823_00430 [Candidatus Gracilibacteria bacterium]|nr:hypothetical protein [Candidatus Gracilibacteria bacterium]
MNVSRGSFTALILILGIVFLMIDVGRRMPRIFGIKFYMSNFNMNRMELFKKIKDRFAQTNLSEIKNDAQKLGCWIEIKALDSYDVVQGYLEENDGKLKVAQIVDATGDMKKRLEAMIEKFNG